MLDHLSHGRLEVGVGRGVSPFELNYHKVDHGEFARHLHRRVRLPQRGADARHAHLFRQALHLRGRADAAAAAAAAASAVLVRLLEHDRLDLGRRARHAFRDASAPTAFAKANIDAYRAALAKRGGPAQPKAEFAAARRSASCATSSSPTPTPRRARIAKPAFDYHLASLNWLRTLHGVDRVHRRGSTSRAARPSRTASRTAWRSPAVPRPCRAEIERQADDARHQLSPDLSVLRHDDARRCAALAASVRTEVMPKLGRRWSGPSGLPRPEERRAATASRRMAAGAVLAADASRRGLRPLPQHEGRRPGAPGRGDRTLALCGRIVRHSSPTR